MPAFQTQYPESSSRIVILQSDDKSPRNIGCDTGFIASVQPMVIGGVLTLPAVNPGMPAIPSNEAFDVRIHTEDLIGTNNIIYIWYTVFGLVEYR